ncbi:hypothetical protein F441_22237 [Phytophthora nicotianae CJ01A1]|uniref:Uncharacterized protein n=1 Tax=Phytophthora nicotianae CJ01A1 TaxID=1317063 RepID=W2VRR2_PHYNI|nr:hypothetical protein F441_22237 [Phytophthora nicotianae CJ01A1]
MLEGLGVGVGRDVGNYVLEHNNIDAELRTGFKVPFKQLDVKEVPY